MNRQELDAYLLSFSDSWLDFPFGESTSVYKVGPKDGDDSSKAKMFALIDDTAKPLRISLKCDPQLAVVLRETYETVLPGYHLSKKHWNTIIYTGQIPDDEFRSLVHMSYKLVVEGN